MSPTQGESGGLCPGAGGAGSPIPEAQASLPCWGDGATGGESAQAVFGNRLRG